MRSTIEELEREIWPEPDWQSSLVLTAHALRKKPINELSPNELRVAFNEDIGTDFLKDRVLEILKGDPIAGDIFDGDLINSVMRSRQFREDLAFRAKISDLAILALPLVSDSELRAAIKKLSFPSTTS